MSTKKNMQQHNINMTTCDNSNVAEQKKTKTNRLPCILELRKLCASSIPRDWANVMLRWELITPLDHGDNFATRVALRGGCHRDSSTTHVFKSRQTQQANAHDQSDKPSGFRRNCSLQLLATRNSQGVFRRLLNPLAFVTQRLPAVCGVKTVNVLVFLHSAKKWAQPEHLRGLF